MVSAPLPNSFNFLGSRRPVTAAAPATLYEVLGLRAGATGQEIKIAYRKLALTCHPDARKGSSAEEFMRLHAAYMTLSEPQKRSEYDRKLVVSSSQRRKNGLAAAASSFSGGNGKFPRFAGYCRRSWETDQCW